MSDRKEFVVYLSSTLADLKEERDVALAAIAGFGVVKTSFRASENGVVVTCTQDVQSADLYVGVLGFRYGYQPPTTENNADSKSITELEYDACVRNDTTQIPRLMFLKSPEAGIQKEFFDALSHKETADRIETFRSRASKDQTAYEFKNFPELKAEIRIRVREKATEFHQRHVTTEPTLINQKELRREQLLPVSIACVPGTDDLYLQKLKKGDNRFSAFELSPDDNQYLFTLDQGIKTSQITLLLLTPASLNRYLADGLAEKLTIALDVLKRRTGFAGIICEGIDPTQLPAKWVDAFIVEYQSGDLSLKTEVTLENLYKRLREKLPALTTEPRLALPYLVIAPTEVEAIALLDPASQLLDQFSDEDEKERRQTELNRVAELIRKKIPQWPANQYGLNGNRRNWRCFSPNPKTLQELIETVIERINASQAGSREQSILRNARIMPRPYEFDEFLENRFGSRMAIESLRDRGCLMIIDELALLHPLLRREADLLLTGSKTAAASICACDPVYAPTPKLLSDFSFLRVGTMIQRFKIDHDPRCELVLNSTERVERWLRFVIPELIASSEDNKGDPNLVAKAHHLFV